MNDPNFRSTKNDPMRQNDGNCSVCVCVESLRERDQRRRSGIGRLIRQPEEQQFRLVSASRFDGGIFLFFASDSRRPT